MSNAVIYARYSCDRQNEQSIEGQLRVCLEYAQRNGYTVVGQYCDRALTGRSDDRPEFQRMIEDSKKHTFQYVIVYKLDRFARNRYDSAIYKRKLRINGVRVLSAMENIGDNPESILLEGMLESWAEYYSIDLSQKIRRGLFDATMKGQFVGGGIPYGLRKNGKTLEIDPVTGPIMKYFLERYAEGVPRKKIIADLNAKGYRDPNGKPFTVKSFQHSIKSEKYIGTLRTGQAVAENAFPALISPETYEAVQQRLKINKRSAAKNKSDRIYLLSGKIYCGLCGSVMQGVSGKSHTDEIYYYHVCAGKRARSGCKKLNERADFIEWYVAEQTAEYVLQPDRIDYIAARIVESYKKEFNETGLSALERQINKLNRDSDKLLTMAIEAPDLARPRIYEKMEEISLQIAELQTEQAKLKIAAKVNLTENEIVTWLNAFCDGDPLDVDFRQRLIDTFINCVYLYDDQVVIYYNIKDAKQVSFIEMNSDLEDLDDSDDSTPILPPGKPHQPPPSASPPPGSLNKPLSNKGSYTTSVSPQGEPVLWRRWFFY